MKDSIYPNSSECTIVFTSSKQYELEPLVIPDSVRAGIDSQTDSYWRTSEENKRLAKILGWKENSKIEWEYR